jgi:hypothetical protein
MGRLLRRVFPGALTITLTVSAVVLPYVSASGGELLITSGVAAASAFALAPNPGCTPNVVPMGQANPPGSQSEPMAPIWCFTLVPQGPPTRVTGANDWIDTFEGVTQMGQFTDGDLDYRVFDSVQNGGSARTMHFTNNNHWMDDNAGGFLGGTMIRPNRSFRFENGKLVVEADVAAGISGYMDAGGGDVAWPEIDISTGPTPNNGGTTDGLYAYGRFPGFDTFGCRIHAGQKFTCSYEAKRGGANGLDTSPCFEFSPDRLVEISGFEQCGTTHFGGDPGFGAPGQYFRTCSSPSQVPDMMCRDRFRLELSQNGLVAYVNGQRYFEDSGWPARNQLPASMVNGNTPVYVYLSDWEDTPNQPAYRFHWQRFAVNPHNANGTIVAPSAASSFCLGQPMNTCATAAAPPTPTNTVVTRATSTPTPTRTPVAGNTSTPTPTRTPVSNNTATPTPTTPVSNTPMLLGINTIQPSRDSNPPGMAEAFQYTAVASGTVRHLGAYVDSTSGARQLVIGLYSDHNGHPGTLLTSGVLINPIAGAWNTLNVHVVGITSGAVYWLAILGPSGGATPRFRDLACCAGRNETSAQTNLTVLPSTWSSGVRYANSPASMYATP